MRLPSIKAVLVTPIVAFFVFYAAAAIFLLTRDQVKLAQVPLPESFLDVAIFGASGTAGDGILKAALGSNNINEIHVVTRRVTPRIQAGLDSGRIQMTLHQDYLDYSAMINQLANVDAVYWAIGISSLGVDEKTYGMIHVDFPMQFVRAWHEVSNNPDRSFHFISSSDISEGSDTMWVREKIRAEKSLFKFAENSTLRVIAYRPDYIRATEEEASVVQNLLYWFFRPVGAAVKSTEIGQAMIDVALRGRQYQNGTQLSTSEIVRHSRSNDN